MRVYTISQVADLVGVSATTVRNAIQAGKLTASKDSGPRGKYQVTQGALDAWVDARRGNNVQAEQCDGRKGKGNEGASIDLIPRDYVEGVQDKLHGAIYRAGQAEARACFLNEEVSRLREERERERDRYEARIRELENNLHQQQKDVMERMEAREKVMLEFISSWRDAAAGTKNRRKPWWKNWANIIFAKEPKKRSL